MKIKMIVTHANTTYMIRVEMGLLRSDIFHLSLFIFQFSARKGTKKFAYMQKKVYLCTLFRKKEDNDTTFHGITIGIADYFGPLHADDEHHRHQLYRQGNQ